ncbi:hypothetical protein OAS07_06415 [Candidatus Thioglobus sp.]|nr:hypothetical protein [Candidatus Thioglobus sp.]MDC3266119.1 hypothetical protein [Candidatus Thioglobus sp.]
MKRLLKIVLLTASLLVFSGCTTNKEMSQYKSSSDSSDYEEAAKFAEKKADGLVGGILGKLNSDTSKKKDLFWSLQAASAHRNAGNYKKSNEWFDIAEESYKAYNEDNFLNNIDSGVTSVLVNDSATDYTGEVYDGILINTYKAMNYLALNDHKNARIEFNRASDRQRRAGIYFSKEIEAKKAELNAKPNVFNSINSGNANQQFAQKYSNLYNFKAYADFQNPYTTYMAGLFAALSNDKSKALNLFKEVYGSTGNDIIKQDFNELTSNNGFKNSVWVVFENGKGMSKSEFILKLPLFMVSREVSWTGVAFPELKHGSKAYNDIVVNDVKTKKFVSMDNVIKSEFKKDLPNIKARAIASAVAKTAIQVALKKEDNLVGDIFAIYQAVSTRADTRIWSSLPKEFQLVKVDMPANGILKVYIGGRMHKINIGEADNAIVTIKVPTPRAKPAISIARFN